AAACLGALAAGAVVGAQDIAGNAASQVGGALDRAAGQAQNAAGRAQNATQNAVNGVRNQANSAASQAGNQVDRIQGATTDGWNNGGTQRGVTNGQVGVDGRANVNGQANVNSQNGVNANVQSSQSLNAQSRAGVNGNVQNSVGVNGQGAYYHGQNQQGFHGQGHSYNQGYGYGGQSHGYHGGQVYGNQYGSSYGGTAYSSGYAGTGSYMGGHSGSGVVHTLRHDASGREYICVGGQRVYFDNVATQNGSYQAGYGSYDQSGDAVNTPEAMQNESMQNNATGNQEEEFSAPALPSADQNTDANVQAGADAQVNGNVDAGNVNAGDLNAGDLNAGDLNAESANAAGVGQDGSADVETGVQAAAKNNATQE
ncbi:hypothetical protein, partial [Novipirellula sp.]|uniref:hypothetical protein n=1 Tax=Novipirellula sp. TaxID=2795430 RepID=UPI00356763AC